MDECAQYPPPVTAKMVLETAKIVSALCSLPEDTARQIVPEELDHLLQFYRAVPSIIDPRRIVCLADRAAENPAWWNANRIHFFCPELSNAAIADYTNLKPHQVRDYIDRAEINTDCYTDLPPIEY